MSCALQVWRLAKYRFRRKRLFSTNLSLLVSQAPFDIAGLSFFVVDEGQIADGVDDQVQVLGLGPFAWHPVGE